MPLHSALVSWQTFYAVLAGVSATFAGLLFVSLSLHLELFHHPGFDRVKRLARHTFSSFVFLVVFSLIFLIPTPGGIGLGVPLLVIGIVALLQTLRHIHAERRSRPAADIRVPHSQRVYVLAALTYVALCIVAAGILLGSVWMLYLIVGPLIWHLAWTTTSAWDLLVELRRTDHGRPASQSPAETATTIGLPS